MAEITRGKNGEAVDTAKAFKDFDTAVCYIANRSAGFVPWTEIGASQRMMTEDVGSGVTIVDFGSGVYFGRIAEVAGSDGGAVASGRRGSVTEREEVAE